MKLSDFRDEKAIEVVADLLGPISKIVANKETAAAKDKGMIEFAAAMLRNSKRDVMDMLAILSGQKPEDYHCTAATVMKDVLDMFSDPELMQLFGLQRQTAGSSGSASESTEAQDE